MIVMYVYDNSFFLFKEDLDITVYKKHRGGFFAYVPLIPLNMEKYGIYQEIKKENYRDCKTTLNTCQSSSAFLTLRSFDPIFLAIVFNGEKSS